jgi:2-polyprenyl-6-hydroxyphenyl methylase / 3-demethylubiquinone-9 3-methyltransferase
VSAVRFRPWPSTESKSYGHQPGGRFHLLTLSLKHSPWKLFFEFLPRDLLLEDMASRFISKCAGAPCFRVPSTDLFELLVVAGNVIKTVMVNNDIYNHLGERWYTARDNPIALLRAEARARNPWIAGGIRHAFPSGEVKVLDIGCGGGFLSNYLAETGFTVSGLDIAAESLTIARRHDTTGRARYVRGDAYRLPYDDGAFHVACAMDFLEHVDEPGRALTEAARILRPHGLFFFSTFNRNFISWLFVIKGMEWFVKNTPPRLHELSHFIKPDVLRAMCEDSGMRVNELRGFVPRLNKAFWRLLVTGVAADDFNFQFVRNPITGYIGMAIKNTDNIQIDHLRRDESRYCSR